MARPLNIVGAERLVEGTNQSVHVDFVTCAQGTIGEFVERRMMQSMWVLGRSFPLAAVGCESLG